MNTDKAMQRNLAMFHRQIGLVGFQQRATASRTQIKFMIILLLQEIY
jgi:hypothetical protein